MYVNWADIRSSVRKKRQYLGNYPDSPHPRLHAASSPGQFALKEWVEEACYCTSRANTQQLKIDATSKLAEHNW